MRCLLVFLFSAAAAYGQLTRGSISGTVRDGSGAVVVGVDVSAREQSTGLRYRTITNEAGVYRIAALEPGNYALEFSKAGFEIAAHENIALDSAQEAVLNPALAVAGTAASVTVDASVEGVSLSKASPVIERRVGHDTLEALPMTGYRDVDSVLILTPGVTYDGSANGQRVGQNISNLDGIDNVDPQFQYRTISMSPEGVEEVHVRTSPYSAELGRGLGAQISLVGRRGTNRLRGEAWDYYNADWISAATVANKRAGLVQSRFVDHQAGASLGGPIRRNRTFFFALFQALPHREGASANDIPNITIPTPAGYAALPRVPLAPGQTLRSREAVLATISFLPDIHRRILRYDSIRTNPINGVPIEFGTTRLAQARPGDYYRSQQRLDHRFTDRNTLSYFGSILTWDSPITRFWSFSNNLFGDRFASSESSLNQTHALSDTHIFSPSLVNETRVSFSRRTVELVASNDTGFRTMVPGSFQLGASPSNPFIRPSNTHQAQNALTWIRARHSIKFGADLIQIVDTLSSTKQNTYNFQNFQSFLNSQPNNLTILLTASNLSLRYLKQNYFVQDDFKLRPELTLNFGVRYQTSSVPQVYFGAATPEIAAAGVPGPLQRDTNDVAPRFGVAYSPQAASGLIHRLAGSGKTVFRGGFGIAYGLAFEGESSTALSSSLNYPYYQEVRFDTAQAANLYPGLPPVLPATSGFNPLLNFTNFRSDAKNQTTQFYSFSIQRQFGQNYFVELGYTGNRSYHLPFALPVNGARLTPVQALKVVATHDFNSIPSPNQRKEHPEWGARTLNETSAYSRYHALYIKFDQRFSRGFLVGANYTWSGAFSFVDIRMQQPNNPDNLRRDYGRSNLDRPHRFVVHYVWQIPGKRVWSGWRISGISQWQSGQPFTITTGVDSNGDGNSTSDRPDYNPAGVLGLDPTTGNWRSFESPLAGGRFVTPLDNGGRPLQYSLAFGGNLGRNTFRGPGFALWNLSIMKPFRLAERIQFEVRADATNVFNHRNFGPPVSNMNNAEFGHNASNPDSRAMLLGAKLRF